MSKNAKEQIEREVVKITTERAVEDQKKGKYNPPIGVFNLFPSEDKLMKQEAYDKAWEAAKKN